MRLLVCAAVVSLPFAAHAAPLQEDLEKAAVIGASLMVCDTSPGMGSGGWNHHIMVGASKMMISQDAATEVVESRTREILSYLNKARKLDEFCDNARSGRL